MRANYLIIASKLDGDKVFGKYREYETAHNEFENIRKNFEDYNSDGLEAFVLYEVVRNKRKKIDYIESEKHRKFMEEAKKGLKIYLKSLGFEVE